jgi:uncharacterized CHY-type Zn-finger protein
MVPDIFCRTVDGLVVNLKARCVHCWSFDGFVVDLQVRSIFYQAFESCVVEVEVFNIFCKTLKRFTIPWRAWHMFCGTYRSVLTYRKVQQFFSETLCRSQFSYRFSIRSTKPFLLSWIMSTFSTFSPKPLMGAYTEPMCRLLIHRFVLRNPLHIYHSIN